MVAPPAVSSAAAEAVELAETAGLVLDPWQRLCLEVMLGERADGRWAAFETGVECQRQNGKGGIIEAVELAGLFLFGEQLILHSAHKFNTAREAFRRLRFLIENTPDLDRRVRQVRQSNEETSIELRSGQRIRWLARSTGSGRGFTGDRVILDECMILDASMMGAVLPTLAARPNPQVNYFGSAPLASSSQWHSVRRRAMSGDPGRLAFVSWSVAAPPTGLDSEQLRAWAADRDRWATANPAMGIRIPEEFIAAEFDALPLGEFLRERLGVGDEPTETSADLALSVDDWEACRDPGASISAPVAFGVQVAPDRTRSAIVAAWVRPDGLVHVEQVDVRDGVRWLPGRMAELHERWSPRWFIDAAGAAGTLVPLVAFPLELVATRDLTRACGLFFDLVTDRQVRHSGYADLSAAVGAARRRLVGDAWVWAQRDAVVDVSPLMAATLAAWGVQQVPVAPAPVFAY
jgi:hypothetical protein